MERQPDKRIFSKNKVFLFVIFKINTRFFSATVAIVSVKFAVIII